MKRINKFQGYKEEYLINRLDDSQFGIVNPNDDKNLEYRLAHFLVGGAEMYQPIRLLKEVLLFTMGNF